MKKSKVMALSLAAAMCVGLLAGCGGGSGSSGGSASGGGAAPTDDGQVTIKFVHKFPEENRMKFFEEIVADFEEQNPNIKIEMTAYGDEEIKDKTRVLLGSADAPDIFFTWSGERITQYVDTGNALNLTEYLNADEEWKNSFNQVMLEASNKGGSYWCIPWDYSSKEMVYNKAIFDEVGVEIPTSYAELLDVCQKIKDAGYTPIAMGNQYPWVVCHYLTTLNDKMVPADVIAKNYSLEDPQFTDPGYAEAMDMVKELYDKGYFNQDANSTTWEMSQSMVQENKAAMIYEEVQNLVNYDASLGDNWGYFDFPEVEGAKGSAGYITGGPDEFMINTSSQHPDECITFLKYLTSDAVQSKMVYDLGFLPVTSVELDATKCLPETVEIIEKNLSAPGMSEWLDCVLNQTVADTWLEGCQTIFAEDDGAAVMEKVSAMAEEVKADQ